MYKFLLTNDFTIAIMRKFRHNKYDIILSVMDT